MTRVKQAGDALQVLLAGIDWTGALGELATFLALPWTIDPDPALPSTQGQQGCGGPPATAWGVLGVVATCPGRQE